VKRATFTSPPALLCPDNSEADHQNEPCAHSRQGTPAELFQELQLQKIPPLIGPDPPPDSQCAY
jgi:hypothetical protein